MHQILVFKAVKSSIYSAHQKQEKVLIPIWTQASVVGNPFVNFQSV